ncbi:MAG: hypothetical protein JWL95_3257 [Gemmatimonadetes bacterium]|nr:hypothetical protein [Gemmatimonadota bacterium]
MGAVWRAQVDEFRRTASRWFWTSPPPGWRRVRCIECRSCVYSTNGTAVSFTLRARPPITLTIGNLCVCFCSRACVLRWIAELPLAELQAGGRRLW